MVTRKLIYSPVTAFPEEEGTIGDRARKEERLRWSQKSLERKILKHQQNIKSLRRDGEELSRLGREIGACIDGPAWDVEYEQEQIEKAKENLARVKDQLREI